MADIIDIDVSDTPADKQQLTPPAPRPTPVARTAEDFQGGGETSIDDRSVSQFKFDLYKGRANVVDRIAVLNSKNIRWHRTHYAKGGGQEGYVLCLSKYRQTPGGEVLDGEPALCCKRIDEARKRFAVLVIHYGTKPDGSLMKPLTYVPKLWRVSEGVFVALRDINAEFPLDLCDIQVRCSDEKFQKIQLMPCRESIIRLEKFPQQNKDDIAAWVRATIPEAQKSLGKKLTEAQLLERLGMATGARTIAQENVVGNLDDLLPSD